MQAESLAHKIKHYLITTMGVTLDEANPEEFYRAFALTLREETMINWTACMHTYKKRQARMLYYLCMEYMPGRFLGNNITNIHATELVRHVMKMMNRNFEQELCYEPDPGLGNGGLGRLAACLLDSLATQQYPAIAYGLRFQYGIFDQEIWDGVQVERPENWLLHENPWEYRRDTHAASVYYAGRTVPNANKRGVEVMDVADFDEVRALAYDVPIIGYKESGEFNVNTLRLWTTKESPRNFQLQRYNAGLLDQAAENTSLTDVLYPNDNNETGKRIRLKQEFLLVSASLQDIIRHHLHTFPDMSNFADKVRIHINDTHPALTIAELQRLLIREHDFGWEEAWEVVKTCCNFTNHTVLRESLEEWNQNRLHYLLPRQYHIIERLNLEFCDAVRKRFPGDEDRVRRMSIIQDGQVRMANLAIFGSHRVNGVAALHTEILKNEVFKDFNEMYPDKFVNVTNGVTQRRWLLHINPKLSHFITKRIGRKWITNFEHISELAAFAKDAESKKEFLEIKRENKRALIHYIHEKNPIRDEKGKIVGHYTTLDESALFDVQIKRIHEYKRQLMNILHAIMVYHELKADPNSRKVKRVVIIAGKAAPGYAVAKNIIHLICCVARKINNDPTVKEKLNVVFMENYNVSRAELIIPGADLSEQISTAGMEASGTGNMKLAMNGALTIGTEDGANIEMHREVTDKWWPFGFGKTSSENAALRSSGSYSSWDIYMHDQKIHEALNSLRDRTFAETDAEHEAIYSLSQLLLEAQNGNQPDRYFVLSDMQAYYETQKRVEEFFLDSSKWAEYAIHNIASMGKFSTDESIHNYAKLVWDIKPCPCDKEELDKVRADYSEHDKCRIL
ncbi:MAG: glycogen/starch/alpha-glucan family phosphorylase [Verrucomicrobia bacterium]|nr:glycogen/starch/alpha-glucan family phosphorylase [Verrucomicrobiota bacterium]